MSASIGRRNNILAGLFLIGSLIVAVALSFVFSGIAQTLAPSTGYTIWFPLSVGAPGIKPGSPVNLGGQPVGRVVRVSRDLNHEGGPRIVLRVALAKDLVLYPDAKAYLEQPLLGTLSAINIRALGSPEAGAALVEDGSLMGGIAPPAFLEAAGVGPEQQEKVQSIIDRVQTIVDEFYASLEETDARTQRILETAERIATDSESIVARISGNIDPWTADVTDTLENIRAGSEEIEPMLAQADTLLADAQAALDSVQAAIDDNRPQIDSIIDNVETTTQRVNDETLPLVNRTIEQYQQPAQEATLAITDVRTLLAEEVPNLRRTIANLRLASDQMKLTLAEVRAAPWRLLERPTTRELEAQLFYDAARTYAEAVSDLRAASESLTAARASGLARPDDLDALLNHLDQAFETYREAETRLLDGIPRTVP